MSDTNPTGRIWPTDLLLDAERRLERLWATFHGGEDWASLDEERAAIVHGVNDTLGRAITAAAQIQADTGLANHLIAYVLYLRDDLAAGCSPAAVIGPHSYAARIEETIEEVSAAWESAEREAGRPRLTQAQQVARRGDAAGRPRIDGPTKRW